MRALAVTIMDMIMLLSHQRGLDLRHHQLVLFTLVRCEQHSTITYLRRAPAANSC